MLMLIFAGESTCTLKNEVVKQIFHQVSFISHKRQNNCQFPRLETSLISGILYVKV